MFQSKIFKPHLITFPHTKGVFGYNQIMSRTHTHSLPSSNNRWQPHGHDSFRFSSYSSTAYFVLLSDALSRLQEFWTVYYTWCFCLLLVSLENCLNNIVNTCVFIVDSFKVSFSDALYLSHGAFIKFLEKFLFQQYFSFALGFVLK